VSTFDRDTLSFYTLRPGLEGESPVGAIGALGTMGAIGAIGMCVCPGRTVRGAGVPGWNRDLGADLDAVRNFGAAALVTLMQGDELAAYSVPPAEMSREVLARGIAWYHLPIVDMCAPDDAFEDRWSVAGIELRALLDDGRNIAVHCLGGLGRTGTVAARLLIEYGERPDLAIARVRDARPGAIQTYEQERYVLRCGANDRGPRREG
jgi:ADP-ribosyl-[dinitrogen reductase] hydrolase